MPLRGSLSASKARYLVILLVALVGIGATFGMFLLVCTWEYRVAEIDFQSRARTDLAFVDTGLIDAKTLLSTIAAYMGSADHPASAVEFGRFSRALHAHTPGLRDTAWGPRVTLADRAAFERTARASGMPGYEIRQFGPHGSLVRAAQRAEYYPVRYADSTRRPPFGFDLISDAQRARAVFRALSTGKPAATPPMDVLTVERHGAGLISYMPVFGPGATTQNGDPEGIVVGLFDVPVMVANILDRNHLSDGVNVYFFNARATGERRVLYRSDRNATSEPSEAEMLRGMHWQSTVTIVDQPIGAIVTPVVPIPLVRVTLAGSIVLLAGFLATTLIVLYLVQSLRRTMQLESITTSLRATTVTLSEKAEEVTQISRHDALTGLPNRLLLRERMNHAVGRARRGSPFALLFLDLDRFKAVNDSLGHAAGDRLLCDVSERILQCIRDTDTAARLGGDEFAIILSDVDGAGDIREVAMRLIDGVSRPYDINDQCVVIGVSIGAAISTASVTAESITAEADLAMYESKEMGRGTFRLFEDRMRTRVDEKRQLEIDLRTALERDELQVYYQPVMDLHVDRVTGLEALVRWHHPVRGNIEPEHFVPIAEECGLIAELGAFVLRTACTDAAAWPEPLKLAVNLSPLQLKDPQLFEQISAMLRASGLSPDRLEIEFTEGAVVHHSEATLALLTQLRTSGISVTFDDFGTGYSSLSNLLRFPFDKIKIDRSFLEHVDTSTSAETVVRAVVGLGAHLNLLTTGEGVETYRQLELLRDCGCTQAQGFLFSAAIPNHDVPFMVRELNSRFAHALP